MPLTNLLAQSWQVWIVVVICLRLNRRDWHCDVQNTGDGLRRATYIFEAAVWHYAVQPVCGCGHSASFHAASLWWRFERKGWNDHLGEARKRFWCRQCAFQVGRRVQPRRLEVVPWEKGAIELEMPSDHEWRRAMRRFRT